MDHARVLDKDHKDGHRISNNNNAMATAAVSITPVVVALVTLLVILFLLVSYYRLLASCYKSWITGDSPQIPETSNSPPQDHQQDRDPEEQQQQQPTLLIQTPALSKSLIQRLPVYKSSKSKRVSSDCAVCLGDFQEGEDVKILPKCGHGFHVECIDTWLSIHSNVCPLCRAQVEDPAAIVVSIDPTAAQVIEDGSSPPLEDHATIGSDRAGGVVTPGIRKKSSSLEEGSPLFRSIFARFSRAGAPPDDQNPSLPSSSSSPEDCRMRRSWSSSRVFSFRRNRQQQSDSLP